MKAPVLSKFCYFLFFCVSVLVLVVKVETLLVGCVAVAPTDAECWTRREL